MISESTLYSAVLYAFIIGALAGQIIAYVINMLAGIPTFGQVHRLMHRIWYAWQIRHHVKRYPNKVNRTFAGGDLEFQDDH